MDTLAALYQTHYRRVRDILAFVALVKYGGDFLGMLTELGIKGSVIALYQYLFKAVLYYARKIPQIKGYVEKEVGKNLREIEGQILKDERRLALKHNNVLPTKSFSKEELLEELRKCKDMASHKWEDGKVSGCVYHGGSELTEVVTAASNLFEWSNPLHADVFPGIRKLEAEVVSMVVDMFHGHQIGAAGALTSGGTESIIMAVRAHKEWARETKGITRPHIVLPITAHVAFDKACEYFGIRITHVHPDDPVKKTISASAMRAAICRNTIMIVGSCVSYPWGHMDDIEGYSKIAKEYNIGLHVDSCLGSFIVAFMEDAGYGLPLFDFRLPGVTSISCDTHKFGFAPKGSSVVMYRSADLRRYQYFCQPNWPGGIYASPSIAGSRPGQVVAGAWAALMYHGKEGYIASCKKIVGNAKKIAAGVKDIGGGVVNVVGDPKAMVVAFESDKIDIYRVGAGLAKRGWNINNLQFPPSIHICCTYMTDGDVFLSDLTETIEEVLQNPEERASGSAAIYGLAAAIPDRSVVDRIARGFIDALYHTDSDSNKP